MTLLIVEFYAYGDDVPTYLIHVTRDVAIEEAKLFCDGLPHPTSSIVYNGEYAHSVDLENILECARDSDYYVVTD